MEETNKKFIEALKAGKGYDYIANHYNDFSRWELKEILLEFIYSVGEAKFDGEDIIAEVVENLTESWTD